MPTSYFWEVFQMSKRNKVLAVVAVLTLALIVCASFITKDKTSVPPPATYTDENGVTHSLADDPPATAWDPPEDFITEDHSPRSTDFETAEDYFAYMRYKYDNDPLSSPPDIHYKVKEP